MNPARKTLAIVTFAALFGCSVRAPFSTPTQVQTKPHLFSTETTFPLTVELTRRYKLDFPDSSFEVKQAAFGTLLQQLENHELDYFTSSHVPPPADIWAAPLAVDGIAIIVNQANGVTDIALRDLLDVFSGRLKNWRKLGGDDLLIAPLTPAAETDLVQEFRRIVMGNLQITGAARLAPNYEAMLQEVSENIDAIGYIPFSRLDRSVRALRVDGIAPDQESLRKRIYPLRSTIYVIGREAPPAEYHNLIGWIQSEAGQRIVDESFSPLP